MLSENKSKIILATLVFFIIGLGIFFGWKFFQEQREIAYLQSLAKNHPDGERFVSELLRAREELRDRDKTNDFQAYLKMGVNLNILGEKLKALEYYQKVLKIDPKNILALNNTANIYDDLGDYEKSESYWLELIGYYPTKPTFYRSLGYLYRYRLNKTPTEIEAFFQEGLVKTNNHPDLLTWLISYFQEIGDNQKFVEYANLLNEQQKP